MTLSIPTFDQSCVLIVGDVMLDRYWYGGTSRISPEAPVPVIHVQDVEERPGGAANVAMTVAALGARPILLGVTGDDHAANLLLTLLRAQGVDAHLQRLSGFATITKMRVVSRHQQLIRLDFEDGFDGASLDALAANYEQQLAKSGAVVLSDYGKGALRDVQTLIARAKRAEVPVLIDPKGNDFSRYRDATVITPNLAEFEAVVGPCHDLDEICAKGETLRNTLGLTALLITRGEQGMTLLHQASDPVHIPAEAREVYDVTGAGDTVIGVLASALAAGQDIERATAFANLAAGIVVGKFGTATASVEELREALDHQHHHRQGIVTEHDLVALVKAAQRRGESVVMTNGCFDLLHVGHVTYLAKAKALGHHLVVAVNDDASVQRLKGHGRPINTLERRMAVLTALESVDWVVPFSEDTPDRLIRAVSPDILAKGGDYRHQDVAGGELVRAQGGRVAILEFEEGYSTTATIQAIQDTTPNPYR